MLEMNVEFLELFNNIAKVAKPTGAIPFKPLTDKNCSLTESGLDSLDMLMLSIFMCEIFGISEEVGKNMKPTTVAEMEEFIAKHKQKEPESIQSAVESVS